MSVLYALGLQTTAVKIGISYQHRHGVLMAKKEISLSPRAVQTINELLTSGARAQIDYDPRTGELKIYEVPRLKTKYKVVVAAG